MDVLATWALLGGTNVGVWDEDGERSLFSFELPSAGGTTDASSLIS